MDSVNRPKLRGLIAEKGFNMTTLAAKAGVTRDSISNLMRGHAPSYRLMKSLARALDMSPEQAGHIFFNDDLRDE
jgi:transcriptional regulator with XRE-family HTH domain